MVVFASLVVVCAVTFAIIKHPPSMQRKMRYDSLRIADLNRVESEVNHYWTDHKKLPDSLSSFCKACTDYQDPETGEILVYEKTGDHSYRVCTSFSLGNEEKLSHYDVEWRHGVGRTCFDKRVNERN